MRKVVVFLTVVLFLTFSSSAHAFIFWSDDFNDGADADLWEKWFDGEEDSGCLTEAEGMLQWTPAWESGPGEQYGGYCLKHEIDFNNDFGFRVDFNNSYTGAGEGADLDSALGINISLSGEEDFYVNISADYVGENIWNEEAGGASYIDGRVFSSILELGEDPPAAFHVEVRGTNSGWLGMQYSATDDLLGVGAFANPEDVVPVWGQAYEDFADVFGDAPVYFSIGGWAEGEGPLLEGPASLDNFSGFVTPEPVSSVLFLVGGASLIAARLRRRKK